MARNRTEQTEAAPAAEVEQVAEQAEAAPAAEKLRFVVLSHRMFGYEIGQEVEFDADEVRPEWLQHLKPVE